MADNELRKTKAFYDNVYGFVFLTEEEYKLIDSLYFHRLRWLNQLGMAFYAFPGAIHNRFSHSVGVLQIVNLIVENLRRVDKQVVNAEIEGILRLTALLHDIGHYPLSHTIEQAYKWDFARNELEMEKKKKKDRTLDAQGRKVEPRQPLDFLGNPTNLNEFFDNGLTGEEEERFGHCTAHHEKFAQVIIRTNGFKNMLNGCGFDLEGTGIIDKTSSAIDGGWGYAPLVASMINSLVDADSLDYVIRDAYSTGVKLGIYDLDNILRQVTLARGPEPDEIPLEDMGDEYTCLGFELESMQSIENFILAKYHWYTQIIYNHRVLIYDEIAKYFYFHLLRRKDKVVYGFNDLISLADDEGAFMKFNDHYFWEKVREIRDEEKGTIMGKMARALVERVNPKHVDFSEWGGIGIIGADLGKRLMSDKYVARDKKEAMDLKREFLERCKNLDDKSKLGFVKSRDIFKHYDRRLVERSTVRMGKDKNWQDIHDVSDLLKCHNNQVLIRFAVYDFSRVLADE